MTEEHDSELRIALAEGLLAAEEVDSLREEARRLRRRPLDVLAGRGRISEETLHSLRGHLDRSSGTGGTEPDASATPGAADAGDPDATVELDPDFAAGPRRFPGFPVRDWDRYEPVKILGQGGMGTVFLARDVRLRRQVALKFVRGDSDRHTARLLVEARAQARVNHDRVCKVYEVGEVEGQVYIAMQYIDGQPLSVAAADLTFEQRAMVIRDAAEGVHEAHRAGIIHRDLKPGNIMVERGGDGQIRTYVMDFGLARDRREGDTETGTIMGTPHYMSPEQARGEVGRLDRRADVYSLGAALYQILSGQPPIPGQNQLEVLSNIARVEPRSLRALDRDVPADLEAIALKCLEKERSARYDSARALAEDLDRFLTGEPVRASRAGLWYRVRKRIRKHRRLVAAGTAGVLVIGLALGWGIKTRAEAAERERLARSFGERVEQVEAIARYSALSRSHDIHADQAKILARIRELETEIGAAGPLAAGPGAYAIGRGYLALGDDARARAALESAWERGFREPRAAYALALVLGQLYRRELAEAERIRNDALRAERKKEIEAQYRDPALAYLRQSEGADVPSKEYVAALIAYYEGRLEDALGHLDAIGEALPWFYEAPQLRGDVLLARAILASHGGDRGRARADLQSGRQAYSVACSIAESVPGVWESAGALEYQAMVLELYGEGDVDPPYSRGIAATSRALAADPDHHASLLLAARFHRSLAEHRSNRGEKVDDLLQRAVAAAEQAVAAAPLEPLARLELSRAHRQWGEAQAALGVDPSAELRKALAAAEAVGAPDRGYDFHVNVGLIFKVWADFQDGAGQSSLENRGKAIESYSRAIELNPRAADVFINLAANYQERAVQPRCSDPDGDLQKAVTALDRALALRPDHVVAHFYQGNVHQQIGARKRLRGEDGRPDLLRAEAAHQKGLSVNPRLHYLHNGVGLVLLDQAREASDRGQDPGPLLARARAAFEKAISAAPDQAWGYNGAGLALRQRAEHTRAQGGDPAEDMRAAEALFAEAVKRLPDQPTCWINTARLHVLRAEDALDRGRDPAPAVGEATAAVERALTLNPKSPEAKLLLGEARGILARWRAGRKKGADEDFESAAQAYRRALELGPEDQDARVLFGAFCRAWAAWRTDGGRDTAPVLAEGLDALKPVLAARPDWADARAVRGGLSLLQARRATDPGAARDLATSALGDLTAALKSNPGLERRWRPDEIIARRLSTPP